MRHLITLLKSQSRSCPENIIELSGYISRFKTYPYDVSFLNKFLKILREFSGYIFTQNATKLKDPSGFAQKSKHYQIGFKFLKFVEHFNLVIIVFTQTVQYF